MSILKRFSDIMSSNINALLDKAEDPVKMIDQLMRNLNDDLNKVKAETASVMAEETRAKREYDECESEVNKMLSYAKKAVDAGNDDDARVFLTKKASLTEKLNVLNTKYEATHNNSVKMKEMYNKLTNEIEELNERKGTIKAKVATAKMQERINKMGSSISNSKSSLDSFSRMEEKANKMLDEANAMAELNSMPSDEIDDLMNKYNTQSNGNLPSSLGGGGSDGTGAGSNIGKNIKDTADNTKRISDQLYATGDNIEYLRDLAEREVINRFTTAKINIEMNNNNNISNDMDIDGVVRKLEDKVIEAMSISPEKVHA